MTEINDPFNKEQHIFLTWLVVALAPILTILFSYIFGNWSWGLMDDLTLLGFEGSMFQRIWACLTGFIGFGEFKPTFALYVGLFYSTFKSNPVLFYISKLLLICLLLVIWGLLGYRITEKKISIVLVPAVTLSFHYFYDSFFFLSSHEFLGILFFGLAAHLFLNSVKGIFQGFASSGEAGLRDFNWVNWFLGVVLLFGSYGAKETFVACGMALGFSFFYLAFELRRTQAVKSLIISGILLILMTVGYAVLLKLFVQSSYTANYSFTNFVAIKSNFISWSKKNLVNHIPWIIAAIFIYVRAKDFNKKNGFLEVPLIVKWGIALGIFSYGGFLLILLPWNTVSYYATPLGLFFAFVVGILIAKDVEKLSFRLNVLLVLFALSINLFICNYALNREGTYQNDTVNLMHSLENNLVSIDGVKDHRVFSNAMEPATAIPGLMNRQWGLNIRQFQYSLKTNEYVSENIWYYLYSPRFPRVDVSVFKDWSVIFYSKNWVVYCRPKN